MSIVKVFGIVVRTIGLCLLVYAIWYIVYGVAAVLGVKASASHKISYFLSGLIFFGFAIYFLRGAPFLVKYCYPAEKE